MARLKVYTNNQFTGHYAVGTAAVIVAESIEQAVIILNEALDKLHLPKTATVANTKELLVLLPVVRILQDGEY